MAENNIYEAIEAEIRTIDIHAYSDDIELAEIIAGRVGYRALKNSGHYLAKYID